MTSSARLAFGWSEAADFLERQVTALNARGPGTVIGEEGEEMRFRWGNHKPMVQGTSGAATATL